MALLSGVMRERAITGSSDRLNSWWIGWAGQRGGRWVQRPPTGARPPGDHAEALQDLTELRDRGFITAAEFERLRARPSA
jgi:Short C-terminal domain